MLILISEIGYYNRCKLHKPLLDKKLSQILDKNDCS